MTSTRLTGSNLESTKGKTPSLSIGLHVYASSRFYPSKVRSLIEEVVLRNLKDREYDHATAKSMAESIADQIKMQVKALNIPSYKIVVQSVIGEITG